MSKKTNNGLPLMDIDRSEASCGGWSACRLMEIAVIRGGKRLPAGEQFSEEETPFPYIRVTDMVNGTINDRELVYVKSDIEPLIRNYKISSQDMYVTIAGTLGQFGRIPEHLDGAQLTENAAMITKIDTSRVDINFLCHYLRSEQVSKQVDIATGTGGGVPKLPLYQIEQFLIQHPSLPEQTKIAEILSTVDRAIEQTGALIAKQQRNKTGLMQDLLTRGIDEHGNLRSEQTHEFRDSPLGRIPVEWNVKPLGQVSNLITNGFVGVATPHYTESSDGIPYLYGNNIRSNHIDIKKVTFITQTFHSRQHKSQLHPGDMLTVQSGHIGTTAVVPESLGASNCHALIITKFKKDIVNPHFVSFYCNFCLETGSMSHLFIGSTIKHINTSDFAKFAIPFPSKKEQSNIADILFEIDRNSHTTEGNLAKLRSLKTALMQDLLTGKKRVTPLLESEKEATA